MGHLAEVRAAADKSARPHRTPPIPIRPMSPGRATVPACAGATAARSVAVADVAVAKDGPEIAKLAHLHTPLTNPPAFP